MASKTIFPNHFRPATAKPATSDRSGEKSATKPPNYGLRPDVRKPSIRTWPQK